MIFLIVLAICITAYCIVDRYLTYKETKEVFKED